MFSLSGVAQYGLLWFKPSLLLSARVSALSCHFQRRLRAKNSTIKNEKYPKDVSMSSMRFHSEFSGSAQVILPSSSAPIEVCRL